MADFGVDSTKFGGAPSGGGPGGGGGIGGPPGVGGPPAGPPGPTEGVLTGSSDTGLWDFIDYGGLLGERGLLYELRLVGDYLEITTHTGVTISGSQPFVDWFEGETGIGGVDTTLPPDEDTDFIGDYYGTGDGTHPQTLQIDAVDPPDPNEILQKKPLTNEKSLIDKAQEVIIDILEPVETLRTEGEIYLGKLARRIPFIGPGWDRAREVLRDKLVPIRDELQEHVDGNERLPEFVKEPVEDAIDFITSIVTLQAVPLPVVYPPGTIPPALWWLPILGWLLQILWWLSRREQSPSLPTQRPYKDPDDDNQEEEPDDFIDPVLQPVLVPFPQETDDGNPEGVSYSNGCFFYKVKPHVWLRLCKKRGYYTFTVSIQDLKIERDI